MTDIIQADANITLPSAARPGQYAILAEQAGR